MSILNNVQVQRVVGYNAASTTNRKGSIVDMQGFDGVLFVATFGTMTSGSKVLLKAAQGDEDDTAKVDVSVATTGEVTSDGTDDVQLALDVYRPTGRYVEAQVEISEENALIEGVVAILYKGSKMPITQADATLAAKSFASPADA